MRVKLPGPRVLVQSRVLKRKHNNYGFGKFKEMLPLLSGCALDAAVCTFSSRPHYTSNDIVTQIRRGCIRLRGLTGHPRGVSVQGLSGLAILFH